MTVQTAIKEEDVDLLCNTLNAEAGRFNYSDPSLRMVFLRAQATITALADKIDDITNK